MKNFKDFLYDKNDILIALLILLFAGLLIFWRMDVIMDYPQTLAEATDTEVTTEKTATSNNDAKEKKKAQNGADGIWGNGVLSKEVTVTVEGGTATDAVQCLVDEGLFDSYDDYAKACKSAGCNPENIKATTFTFDIGSTPKDIAKQVTR